MKKEDIKAYLSEIKDEEDLEKTATFTDIVSRREYKDRKKEKKIESSEKTIPDDSSTKITKAIDITIKKDTSPPLIKEEKKDYFYLCGVIIFLAGFLYSGYCFFILKLQSLKSVAEMGFILFLCLFYGFSTSSKEARRKFGLVMIMLLIISFLAYKILVLNNIIKI